MQERMIRNSAFYSLYNVNIQTSHNEDNGVLLDNNISINDNYISLMPFSHVMHENFVQIILFTGKEN